MTIIKAFIIVLLVVLTSAANAATLASVTETDPLGYACIPDYVLDQIYPKEPGIAPLFVVGKGSRLPRTCVPKPCDQPMTPEMAAVYLGYTPIGDEWDQLYSDYAEYCRAETTPFGVTPASERVPFMPHSVVPVYDVPPSTYPPNWYPPTYYPPGYYPPTSYPPTYYPPIWYPPTWYPPVEPPIDPPVVPPVPISGTMILMFGALGALVVLKRRG
jgi:hypothetical protein